MSYNMKQCRRASVVLTVLCPVSVVEDGGVSEEAVGPAPGPRGEAWVELGPALVGAMLRRVLRLCSERATQLTYIILAHDEGDFFDLQVYSNSTI